VPTATGPVMCFRPIAVELESWAFLDLYIFVKAVECLLYRSSWELVVTASDKTLHLLRTVDCISLDYRLKKNYRPMSYAFISTQICEEVNVARNTSQEIRKTTVFVSVLGENMRL
jgi:hypothetical protein